jgi:hypothetical protein
MNSTDDNDSEVEESWCRSQRASVESYLLAEGVKYRRIGDWPAWHVAPYVAVWAVESQARPEWIGWWVVSGDLPTDYISAADLARPQHPRKAVHIIAQRWLAMAEAWSDGCEFDAVIAGPHALQELAPLLVARAKLLMKWVEDDSCWEEE